MTQETAKHKKRIREPRFFGISAWVLAVLGALVFSGIVFLYVSNYLNGISFVPKISAQSEGGECPEGSSSVAINNYPGANVVATMPDAYKHKQFEDAMGGNYRCSIICISSIKSDKGLTDPENIKAIKSYFDGATIGGKAMGFVSSGEDFKNMLKNAAERERMAQTVVLSSTKQSCVGATQGSEGNSVDYSQIKLKHGLPIYPIVKNTTACRSSALGIGAAGIPGEETKDQSGCPPGTTRIKNPPSTSGEGSAKQPSTVEAPPSGVGAGSAKTQPIASSSPELQALQQCWGDFYKTAAEHTQKHLGITFPRGLGETDYMNAFYTDLTGNTSDNKSEIGVILHPNGGADFYGEIWDAFDEFKKLEAKKNGINSSNSEQLLQKCQKIIERTNSLETSRNDIENLAKCKAGLNDDLKKINNARLNIFNETTFTPGSIFGYNDQIGNKSLKGFLEFLNNFKVSLDKQRYRNNGNDLFQGVTNASSDLANCRKLRQDFASIMNKYPALSEGSKLTKVYVVGNVAISNNNLNSSGQANNISVRDPIHVCVYLNTDAGDKTECKAIKTQRRDGGFWVDFDIKPDVLSELVNSHSGKKVFVYAVWNASSTTIRNRYISFSPNQGDAVTMDKGQKNGKTEYTIGIHKPIVLYGQASSKRSRLERGVLIGAVTGVLPGIAAGLLGGSVEEPRYQEKGKNMVVEELKRFMTESGSENCLFRAANTLPNPPEWKNYKKNGP